MNISTSLTLLFTTMVIFRSVLPSYTVDREIFMLRNFRILNFHAFIFATWISGKNFFAVQLELRAHACEVQACAVLELTASFT